MRSGPVKGVSDNMSKDDRLSSTEIKQHSDKIAQPQIQNKKSESKVNDQVSAQYEYLKST